MEHFTQNINENPSIIKDEMPQNYTNEAKVKPVVINFSKDVIIDEESSQNIVKQEILSYEEENRELFQNILEITHEKGIWVK